MALELKHVVETNLIRVSYHCSYKPLATFTLTFPLDSCMQTSRQSILVAIKVGVVGVHIRVSRCLKEGL